MSRNHFAHASAAERYARGRPYFHPLVASRIRERTGALARALDVGCGTGMSAVPLSEIAGAVVGVDASTEMLEHACVHPQVRYAAAAAEALPFRAGAFDLVTAGMAFHWFDRSRFLAEAARVLREGGWLVIYNHWFQGRMRENAAFAQWWREHYLARCPSPLRSGGPVSDAEASSHGFAILERLDFENEVRLSPVELVAYLSTQSNVIAAVEEGQETIAAVTDWLSESLAPLFRRNDERFAFGGIVWMLRKRLPP